MYRLQKKFVVPIGHRLSLHDGRCKCIHGHEFAVIIGIKFEKLDDNGMVMDFSELKGYVKPIIDKLDHGLMINKNDPLYDHLVSCSSRVIEFDGDPTAENLSEWIYFQIKQVLEPTGRLMDFVTVYENQDSAATYSED